MTVLKPDAAKAMARALRDFGYSDITTEIVQKAIDDLLAGTEAKTVIDMFVEGWLKEVGII